MWVVGDVGDGDKDRGLVVCLATQCGNLIPQAPLEGRPHTPCHRRSERERQQQRREQQRRRRRRQQQQQQHRTSRTATGATFREKRKFTVFSQRSPAAHFFVLPKVTVNASQNGAAAVLPHCLNIIPLMNVVKTTKFKQISLSVIVLNFEENRRCWSC